MVPTFQSVDEIPQCKGPLTQGVFDTISVALLSDKFRTPAISRRQIELNRYLFAFEIFVPGSNATKAALIN